MKKIILALILSLGIMPVFAVEDTKPAQDITVDEIPEPPQMPSSKALVDKVAGAQPNYPAKYTYDYIHESIFPLIK